MLSLPFWIPPVTVEFPVTLMAAPRALMTPVLTIAPLIVALRTRIPVSAGDETAPTVPLLVMSPSTTAPSPTTRHSILPELVIPPMVSDPLITIEELHANAALTAQVAELPEMPLFLSLDRYVKVPLESTYQTAWKSMPQVWRDVIESQR